MAEEREGSAAERLTGFEQYSTEILLKIRKGQEQGLAEVHKHLEAGTLNVRRKPGAATAKEAGETIVMLSDAIDLVLQERGVLE